MKKHYFLYTLLSGFVTLTSCEKDKTQPVDAIECNTVISYSMDIQPIIQSSCMTGQGAGTGCHDAWITDYSQVKSSLDGGGWQAVVLEDRTMPKIPNDFSIDSLTADEFATMYCWIEQGYPEN